MTKDLEQAIAKAEQVSRLIYQAAQNIQLLIPYLQEHLAEIRLECEKQ